MGKNKKQPGANYVNKKGGNHPKKLHPQGCGQPCGQCGKVRLFNSIYGSRPAFTPTKTQKKKTKKVKP